MLYIFSGLPGTGKSTLATALAQARNAVYLRVDTIEQAIRRTTGQSVGPEGYDVAYAIALENLRLKADVVADSVNSLVITRDAWHGVAAEANCSFVDIEVVCSDVEEHKCRIETRIATVEDLKLPTWAQVMAREYMEWTGDLTTIDTANETIEQSVQKMFAALGLR